MKILGAKDKVIRLLGPNYKVKPWEDEARNRFLRREDKIRILRDENKDRLLRLEDNLRILGDEFRIILFEDKD